MIYIINTMIVFDPVTRSLALKNDAQLSVELSKPATRLLSELIEHNQLTLIREDLIKSVWEDYGFSPSKGNLSNSISELRKAFISLGLHKEIIITVPRTGFKMEAEIHPVVKSVEKKSAVMIENVEPEPFVPPPFARMFSLPAKLTDKVVKLKGRLLITVVIFIVMIAGIVFLMFPKSQPIRLVTTIGMCNIYGLNNDKPPSDFTINVKKMIESEGVDCINESAGIYYADSRPSNRLLKVRFMAVCRNNDTSRYQHCTTYKIVK
ncbi:winged helix-turn-helix domain-containing protein [Serratia fonticola]|uniref:Winged helix-turn-helix domain-containing protein n=1 Tax=Serratia fonticola TaxID=47917 RepID=A0AAW3WLL7_SERFO|nr:winged helix-turn-helix domain-containing protein [Serratia fonticola]MBC3211570.1 winged helix-turn-helix domain-containing protein [Serratia fonticola]NYA12553.1 winged helix-turn-helix domain-containing protein [Serratia fonticola]NYA32132.1 winged helix-turn-helix domain-containing protein [Serratia fonticola]